MRVYLQFYNTNKREFYTYFSTEKALANGVVINYFLFGFLLIFNSLIKSSNKVVSIGSNISHFPS